MSNVLISFPLGEGRQCAEHVRAAQCGREVDAHFNSEIDNARDSSAETTKE